MTLELLRGWALLAAGLFFGSLVHEDVAIFAGSYLVVEQHLPTVVAALSLYAGVVFGDCAIYGLGRLARRSRRMDDILGRLGGHGRRRWISQRLFWVVCGCRLTPAMLFPTFAAIGWAGVPFRRFAMAVLVSAILYVPPLFFAAMFFGTALIGRLQAWGWPVMATGAVAVWLLRRQFGGERTPAAAPAAATGEGIAVHRGMPPLAAEDLRVPLSERIPPLLFYTPLAAQWLWLGLRHGGQTLPALANPRVEAGGLLGESKGACLAMVAPPARCWLAAWAAFPVERGADAAPRALARLRQAMDAAGLAYPVILKPDIGWRGIGVRRVDDPDAALGYLQDFPAGQRVIVQEFVAYDGEAGLFYVRHPDRPDDGRIFSLTFRYYPFVVGDGRSTLRELILANERTRWKAALHLSAHAGRLGQVPAEGQVLRLAAVGSNRVGGLYIDARRWITPAMTARFDEIVRAIPEFWFGRFDLRFDTLDALQAGRGFRIVEINGAGAEAIHMWDPKMPLAEAYRTLFEQQSLMFSIGAANRRRGFAPPSLVTLAACRRRQQTLLPLYPASN